jgi:hypothetical protein
MRARPLGALGGFVNVVEYVDKQQLGVMDQLTINADLGAGVIRTDVNGVIF